MRNRRDITRRDWPLWALIAFLLILVAVAGFVLAGIDA